MACGVEHTRGGSDDRRRDGHLAFRPTLPIATYLTAVAAGPFERRIVPAGRSRTQIGFYARSSLIEALDGDVDELAEIIDHGLEHFGELFGTAYPFGKLDVVFAPEYTFGAMEHPGAITANERFIFTSRVTQESRRRRSEVLLHELAHMWFGNLVGIRWWDDLWLSESFAVWAAAHAQAGTDRFASAWTWFAHDAVVTARHADSLPARQPVALDADDTAAARLGFTAITYRKGAALLRQLARHMGDESFAAGLRRYVAGHAWGNADLADLVVALDAETDIDVGAWAETSLRRAGVTLVTTTGSPARHVVQRADPDSVSRSFALDGDTYALRDGRLRRHDRLAAEVDGAKPVEIGSAAGAAPPDAVLPSRSWADATKGADRGDQVFEEAVPAGAGLGGGGGDAEDLAVAALLTPVATITAILMTRPPSRTFIVNASAATNVYGPASSGRSRKSRTSSSRSRAITDTCDFDRPVIPRLCTSRSIRRVETPSR